MGKIYVLDSETTGTDREAQIIELAYLPLPTLKALKSFLESNTPDGIQKRYTDLDEWLYQRFNPTVPINKHAFAVHKLSKLQLIREPSSLRVHEYLPTNMKYMIGHQISFDYKMLGGKPEGVKLICTLALVKKLKKEHEVWKKLEIEDNKLDSYMSVLYPELTFSETHNAKDDCIKVILLLCKLLPTMQEIETWEDLYSYLNPEKEEKK